MMAQAPVHPNQITSFPGLEARFNGAKPVVSKTETLSNSVQRLLSRVSELEVVLETLTSGPTPQQPGVPHGNPQQTMGQLVASVPITLDETSKRLEELRCRLVDAFS